MKDFLQMPVPIQMALSVAGFTKPTAIQEQAIPPVAEGRDVIGIAQTGTGKTAAYLLPILQRLLAEDHHALRALILCPTRELALQVTESIAQFSMHTGLRYVAVYGGVPQRPQVQALRRGVDLLVATPGRLLDLQQQGHLRFDKINHFVLDEADRMLDMGFINDIRKLSRLLPKRRQTLLFSATMSKEIAKLAHTLLHDPVRVEVAAQVPVEKIEQHLLFVDRKRKIDLLAHLLDRPELRRVLIFTKTKRGADKLCRVLKKRGVSAQQIHGDRTQGQRTRALQAFAAGKSRCLVATDVAARGIDIDDITHVINYDLPMEPENYTHRIGRTARAGATGTSYSFCTSDDRALLNAIQRAIGKGMPVLRHPFHSESAEHAPVKKTNSYSASRSSIHRSSTRSPTNSSRGASRSPTRRSESGREKRGREGGDRHRRGGRREEVRRGHGRRKSKQGGGARRVSSRTSRPFEKSVARRPGHERSQKEN